VSILLNSDLKLSIITSFSLSYNNTHKIYEKWKENDHEKIQMSERYKRKWGECEIEDRVMTDERHKRKIDYFLEIYLSCVSIVW